jgi:small subunit ribosomal protein S19e
MTTVYDVPPGKLVKLAAEKLKKNKAIHLPKWAMDVKKGTSKELPPQDMDWWWVRCASVLRQIYIHGPVGVSRLRTYYGGRIRRGAKPERFREASGKIIRAVLLQLEEAEYVIKPEKGKKGRIISPKGQSFLDDTAHEIKNSQNAKQNEGE